MGSAVEYYDFFLFGTAAALIFPKVFFPVRRRGRTGACRSRRSASPTSPGPVGAFILGHFGDRIGRRKVLMFTLVLMGVSTFADRLPAHATPPSAGSRPALLVLCRLLQGFSAAGEQAGASSLTLEHAPDDRRVVLHVVDADRHPGRPDPGLAGDDPVRVAARRRQVHLGLASSVLAQRHRRRWSPTSSAAGCTRRPEFDEAKATGDDRPACRSCRCCATTGKTSSA